VGQWLYWKSPTSPAAHWNAPRRHSRDARHCRFASRGGPQLGAPLHDATQLPVDATTGRPRDDAEALLCQSEHAGVLGSTVALAATGTLPAQGKGAGSERASSDAASHRVAHPTSSNSLSLRDTVGTVMGLTGGEGSYGTEYSRQHVFTQEVRACVRVFVARHSSRGSTRRAACLPAWHSLRAARGRAGPSPCAPLSWFVCCPHATCRRPLTRPPSIPRPHPCRRAPQYKETLHARDRSNVMKVDENRKYAEAVYRYKQMQKAAERDGGGPAASAGGNASGSPAGGAKAKKGGESK
jgi:hypothetical protein